MTGPGGFTRDGLASLVAVAQALAAPAAAWPAPVFAALDRAAADLIGHRLFTVLRHHPEARETERLYTSQPAAFPVGGRKAVRDTPSTRAVYGQAQPWIGRTADDIRAAFLDHALILSLGCESVLNVPVIRAGRVLGTINLLHQAGWYQEAHLPLARLLAALAVPALHREG